MPSGHASRNAVGVIGGVGLVAGCWHFGHMTRSRLCTPSGEAKMKLRRWLALCGAAATILLAVSFLGLGGNTPDDKASAAKVLSFYRDHKGAQLAAALMVAIAAVLSVLFGA